ncbi:hypothetical protein LshimejAT787_0904950 [Lyophyllum shimeji]|uniref:Uncharacterized protein n=1 Tax=Lyophyllum shimeji TaxID=47721 RepID=A0A9P3PRB0_LYOSH|nr:hypothetical protein LshimejAT787_0904950 [Lyophyllum shimeji]
MYVGLAEVDEVFSLAYEVHLSPKATGPPPSHGNNIIVCNEHFPTSGLRPGAMESRVVLRSLGKFISKARHLITRSQALIRKALATDYQMLRTN